MNEGWLNDDYYLILYSASEIEDASKKYVALHGYEKRELGPDEKPQNLVLHFNPSRPTDMLVTCVWDRWAREGESQLLSSRPSRTNRRRRWQRRDTSVASFRCVRRTFGHG